jgi:hypothetical protein
MRIIGCDLHATELTIAILNRETREVTEKTLKHEGETVREFYAAIPTPAVVGIEATGACGSPSRPGPGWIGWCAVLREAGAHIASMRGRGWLVFVLSPTRVEGVCDLGITSRGGGSSHVSTCWWLSQLQ